MKSLNYEIQALCFEPLMPRKLFEYTKLEKHTQKSCLKFTAVNMECFVWEKECGEGWVPQLSTDGLALPAFSLGIVWGLLQDAFAWQHKAPLLEPLPSISPGFPFRGAFLATVARFFLCCSLGADRNLCSQRLQHWGQLSVRINCWEIRGLCFKELLKIICVGTTVAVYKDKAIGGIRIASFIFMLCDMTEMVSLNIKYQNM